MIDLPQQPNLIPKHIFNPLLEDFTVSHLDDDNVAHDYTLHGMEVSTFPTYLAEYIERHLITHIGNKRGWRTDAAEQVKEIRQEITAEIDA